MSMKKNYCLACRSSAQTYGNTMLCKEHATSPEKRGEDRECPVIDCERIQERGSKNWKGYCKIHMYLKPGGRNLLPDGTRSKTPDGYINLKVGGKWVQEHRYIMESMLGRKLHPQETVHHKNGLRDDNRTDNLELWVGPPRFGRRAADVCCKNCGTSYEESVINISI